MYISKDAFTTGISPGHLRHKKTRFRRLADRKITYTRCGYDGMSCDITGIERYANTGNDYKYDLLNLVERLEGKSRER